MKNLKAKKIEKTTLSKIYGGKVVNTHGSRNTVVNGTQVVEIMSDAFDDKDNDGNGTAMKVEASVIRIYNQ